MFEKSFPNDIFWTISSLTRKHSSRKRTARLLTTVEGGVSRRGYVCSEGVCLGDASRGMSKVCVCPGGVHITPDPEADTSPRGQTDTCKNITLPQTSFAGGNNYNGDNNIFVSCKRETFLVTYHHVKIVIINKQFPSHETL